MQKQSVLGLAIFFLFFPGFIPGAHSQESKSPKRDLKNTIRINLTNPLIFGSRSFIMGYERTVGKHQSFSVNLGQFSLPKLFSINTDSLHNVSKSNKSSGFSLSADYRFYLAKENQYHSPHGIYIGPYTSFNYFDRKFDLHANTASFTGDLSTDFSFRVATLGFQLGYQFVIGRRFTLDLILFGPGISSYKVKAALSTSLDPDSEAELFTKINAVLKEKIPGYSLVVKPGAFEKTGSGSITSFGYRYIVMAGFRF
ncbi:MAG: DUF3575 domain-containing protein [Bacteroidota bacterium]